MKLTSMTVSRLEMAICGAARPMPWAAYMLSNISATSVLQRGVEDSDRARPAWQHRVGILHDCVDFQCFFRRHLLSDAFAFRTL